MRKETEKNMVERGERTNKRKVIRHPRGRKDKGKSRERGVGRARGRGGGGEGGEGEGEEREEWREVRAERIARGE